MLLESNYMGLAGYHLAPIIMGWCAIDRFEHDVSSRVVKGPAIIVFANMRWHIRITFGRRHLNCGMQLR